MAFNPNQPEISKLTLSTKEGLVAKKFEEKFKTGSISVESLTTDEAIIEALNKSRLLVGPGATADLKEVIKILKETGVIPSQGQEKPLSKNEERLKAFEKKVEVSQSFSTHNVGSAWQKVEEENNRLKAEFEAKKKAIQDEKVRKAEEAQRIEAINKVSDEIKKEKPVILRAVTERIGKDKIEKQKHIEVAHIFDDPVELEHLYQESLQIAGNLEDEIDYNSFIDTRGGIYTAAQVERDMNYLFSKTAEFDTARTQDSYKWEKISTIAETGLQLGISRGKWFGKTGDTYAPSRLDDLAIGADLLASLDINDTGPDNPILAIDVTTQSPDQPGFEKKVYKQLNAFRDHRTPKVKYFQDDEGNKRPTFTVPKFIIQFPLDTVKELAYLIKHRKENESIETLKKFHYMAKVTGQIIDQCKLFGDFAKEYGDYESAALYEKVSKKIRALQVQAQQTETEVFPKASYNPVTENLEDIIAKYKREHPITKQAA